jgi:ditrans,polycis-polyprenyl diphosphate synthase
MDGNRRWAQEHHLEKAKGHFQGYEKLEETLEWCRQLQIRTVTVYAFSIENFKRSRSEVETLMDLADKKLNRMLTGEWIEKYDVYVRVCGDYSLLPDNLIQVANKLRKATSHRTSLILNICFAYTSQNEIFSAMQSSSGKAITEIDSRLYITERPDIIIRTSGETRLSDFLTWQGGSSLLHFCNKHWPDFSEWDFFKILLDYQVNYTKLQKMKNL